MKNFFMKIGGTSLAIFMAFIGAIFSGLILFFLWPHTIPVFLPTLINSGVLPMNPDFWPCVFLAWVFGILFNKK